MTNNRHQLARLKYTDGGFHLLEQGGHVICAVTGAPIPLADLRYWSVDLQEPYIDAEAAISRMQAAADARKLKT
jgi:hypothetical protein